MLKLHLIDLLSICYTVNFATNTLTNRTDGTMPWSAIGAISSSLSVMTLLIATHRVVWRIVSNSTVVHIKMGHASKTTPL